jgi:hypothetical protein
MTTGGGRIGMGECTVKLPYLLSTRTSRMVTPSTERQPIGEFLEALRGLLEVRAELYQREGAELGT